MTGTKHDPTEESFDRETEIRQSGATAFAGAPDKPRRRISRIVAIGLGLLGTIPILMGTAAAQTTVGGSLCGTPIANFINSAAPLVVALAMVVGTVFAYVMHSRTGFAGDVEQAKFYTDWRNRAAYTAVTAPLLAFLLEMMIGFTGTGVASCIDLVPFF